MTSLPDFLRHLREAEPYRGLCSTQLLARYAQDRDQGAFRALMTRHGPALLRACRRVLRDQAAAEDAVQEVFVALSSDRHFVFANDCRLNGWLCRRGIKIALQTLRGRRRCRTREGFRPAPPAVPDPSEMVSRSDQFQKVVQLIARLSEHQRYCVLQWLEGKTQGEIAQELGIKPDTVSKNLNRGLHRLRAWATRLGLGAGLTALACPEPSAAMPLPERLIQDTLIQTGRAALGTITGFGTWANWRRVAPVLLVICTLGIGLALNKRAENPREGEGAASTAPLPLPLTPRESFQDRNLRLLRTAVLPQMKESLKGLLLDGGEVEVLTTAAEGDKVFCVLEGRHKIGLTSRVRFEFEPQTQTFDLYLDATGTGEWKPIDPGRPVIVRWADLEIPWRLKAVGEIREAFHQHIPPDEDEFAARLSVPGGILFPEGEWTGNQQRLFVLVDRDRIWSRRLEFGGPRWEHLGTAPAWSLAASADTLFCWHPNGRMAARPAAGGVRDWTLIDPLPVAGTTGHDVRLAATSDRLFAWAWDEGKARRNLFVRAATPAPMAWKRIGNCPGEWFAATRDRLLTIAPPGILLSRPATELPLEAEAWEVVEKPCDARYLAVVGETLYRRDTQDRVWTRPVAGGPRAWRLVGRVDPEPQEREFNAGLQGPQGLPVFPRAEYAGHPEHLYLAQGNGSLWARTEGTGANPWRLVGRVPGPTIAANPTTLFAWVPPLGIQARPADLAIHDWQPIDPLPLAPPYAGFVHLAATPHWLFAWAWEEGRPVRGLYVRPATTTAHPFRRIGTCPGEWIVASADCLFAPTDDGTLAARPATPDYLEAKDWVPVEKCDIRFLTGGPGGMILRWDRQGRVWSRGTTPGPEPWRQVGLAQKEGIP